MGSSLWDEIRIFVITIAVMAPIVFTIVVFLYRNDKRKNSLQVGEIIKNIIKKNG
jgi:NADH:ubiquinone oxidoreductase subunit K